MDDSSHSRLSDRLSGDGWLLTGRMRVGQVTYEIDVHEVRTSLGSKAVSGTEFRVRLLNHAIDAADYQGQRLTLQLRDGRRIVGFLSDDGESLVRTGALA